MPWPGLARKPFADGLRGHLYVVLIQLLCEPAEPAVVQRRNIWIPVARLFEATGKIRVW